MPSHDKPFYNLKRLHAVFAVSSLALLAATICVLVADYRREWKQYQRTYREQVDPGRREAIEQIWLPELTINYNFRHVARFDRCTTCHLGIDKTVSDDKTPPACLKKQPFAAHPRLDLFVGSQSPHPAGEFGCTICHAGQGSATTFRYASHTPNESAEGVRWQKQHGWFRNHDWDFPMRPARFGESGCLQCHHDVVDLEPSERFPDPPAPKLLAGYHLVRQLGCFGCHEIKGARNAGERVGPDMRLEPSDLLATDSVAPGTMRKVGPSLREIGVKLDRSFVHDWLRRPSQFRPETRMPQFFGHDEHLEGKTLADNRRFEAVEIAAVAEYLWAVSQPVAVAEAPVSVTESPSVERGKRLFALQGCLACHKHADFPEGVATQGPDLSRLGSKYNTPAGAKWLADWLRDPIRHSPRTLMPNPMLSATGSTPVTPSDPAADLAAYLLSPSAIEATGRLPVAPDSFVDADLDELGLDHLRKTYPPETAETYWTSGIPESMAGKVPGDVRELVGPSTREKKLRYVGRATIRKRGCYGCHDIPGFETAPLIGPALSDWGRKQESLLAFGRVGEFLAKEHAAQPADPPHTAFYQEAVGANRREGFLWQKLRAPRSFDYRKTQNASFNEQLLMGRFTLSADEREAIITFVLGLVAEPPAKQKYVPAPNRQRQAIVEGRKVLDQYGCALCHTLEMEHWTLRYDPKTFPGPPETPDFDFLAPKLSPAVLEASAKPGRDGFARAEVVGMPRVDAQGKLLVVEGDEEDEGGEPLPQVGFTLWEPAAVNGQVWRVGGPDLMLYEHQIVRKRPAWGGAFSRLLYPKALADAKASGSTASEIEAWGWGPPPLVHEGSMVQPAWLYDFLQNPSVIRPAAVLRMPKYNLSPAEAATLVDYFAAASGAEFPYVRHAPARVPLLAPVDAASAQQSKGQAVLPATMPHPVANTLLAFRDAEQFKTPLRQAVAHGEGSSSGQAAQRDQAMRLLTDRTTYCAKCHLIGDYSPGGETRTVLAPRLDQVGRRIRPEYVRRWLANPKSVLPYTAMPVNFPPTGQPMGQDLYPGSSFDQLDAVTELLLNYDDYLQSQLSIRARIEQSSTPTSGDPPK